MKAMWDSPGSLYFIVLTVQLLLCTVHAFHEGKEDSLVFRANAHHTYIEPIKDAQVINLSSNEKISRQVENKNSDFGLNPTALKSQTPTTVPPPTTTKSAATTRKRPTPPAAKTSAKQTSASESKGEDESKVSKRTTVSVPEVATTGSTKVSAKQDTSVPEESAGNSATVSGLSSTTTVAPSTTSTTPKPTRDTNKIPKDHYCLCDLHNNVCDMNCCCDADCNEEDRLLFSECGDGFGLHDPRSAIRRQRSCFQNLVFYKHYNAHNLQQTEEGMLCILRDNNKADNQLPLSQISEVQDRILKGTLSIKRKYEWDQAKELEYQKKPYKYGSPILGEKPMSASGGADRKKLLAFGLPSGLHSSSCSLNEPVRFLQNFYSKCQLHLRNLAQECETVNSLDANFFLQSLDIIANPEDETYEIVPVTRTKSCIGDLCSTEPIQELISGDFPSPVINMEKRVCQGVIVKLNLTFLHVGIHGVSEVLASAELQDIPLAQKEIYQEYRVTFQWADSELSDNSTNSTTELVEEWPRSGNPGYIVGKPVILGEKVRVLQLLKNETKAESSENDEMKEVEMIKVWRDPSRWLTIHNPGKCSKFPLQDRRTSVLFDYGHSTSCALNITQFKYCEDLQIEVAKILFGTNDSLSFEKASRYVAAYGNSNPKEPSEWVPLTFKNFPILSLPNGAPKTLISKGCDGIISTLHIRIAFSFVGSVEFPQARITGVLYELGDPTPIRSVQNEICTQSYCQIHEEFAKELSVTTTVTFKDVTAPPVIRVPRWPILSIRLPADFFYPFASPSSSSKNTFHMRDFGLLVLCKLIVFWCGIV